MINADKKRHLRLNQQRPHDSHPPAKLALMIKAIIVDDEPINIINLKHLLARNCAGVEVVANATSADDARTLIDSLNPQLVFLDIQMPLKNGFDLLRELPALNFELIFVTAFEQYGIQAIKFAAIDYLLKPVSSLELQEAVKKAATNIERKKQNSQLEFLVEMLRKEKAPEDVRIALPSQKETRFVQAADIIRCESSNAYTRMHLSGGEKIVVSIPIAHYDELLSPHGFIRSHQSHLVNRRFVKSLVKESGGFLLMKDGTEVPVSRHKRDEVKTALLN
jgi:two-component system LytT family response regulator